MKDHILVTGGAGYLGSIICPHLLDAGYRVTVIDKLLYGQHSLFHLCANSDFEFIRGDVRDKRLMRDVISKVDAIIPLAAIVGAPACDADPWLAQSTNFEAIQLIRDVRSPSQLVVYPTTNSGYGTKSGDVFCTEDTPLEPISLYGKTKVMAEADLLHSKNVITLRLATVFGMSPRMRLDLLVNHFVYAAVTDGYIVLFEKDFKRNYVHIRDVAACFQYCIENSGNMAGRPYNVGLDEANLSKEQLAFKVKKYVPAFYIHASEIGSDPDKRNYIVSNQRLSEAGFIATRTLDDGIVELLKGYRMMGRQLFGNI
ncbi:NAD-dependent epimerase/dehydratase [candidate division KSB1 bacterium]|nr:NAD-dependent epimerase/dehydratase [candidate division KSB1 bacterium]